MSTSLNDFSSFWLTNENGEEKENKYTLTFSFDKSGIFEYDKPGKFKFSSSENSHTPTKVIYSNDVTIAFFPDGKKVVSRPTIGDSPPSASCSCA